VLGEQILERSWLKLVFVFALATLLLFEALDRAGKFLDGAYRIKIGVKIVIVSLTSKELFRSFLKKALFLALVSVKTRRWGRMAAGVI